MQQYNSLGSYEVLLLLDRPCTLHLILSLALLSTRGFTESLNFLDLRGFPTTFCLTAVELCFGFIESLNLLIKLIITK